MFEVSREPITLEGIFFEGTPPAVAPRPARSVGPRVAIPAPTASDETREFFRWLFQRAGLPGGSYRTRPLVRRLPPCLRFLGVRTIAEARTRIVRQPELAGELMNVVLLGVTEFWRDRAVFESMAREIFPPILSRKNRLRIWSAACSDGPELYSLAMILDELGGLHRAEFLGTDCRTDAILQARAGTYASAALGALRPGLKERYFEPHGHGLRVLPLLRSPMNWKVADLFAGGERGPWDMILWRNMSIYLETAPAEVLWRRLATELACGGHLVVGKADHPPASLRLERVGPCIYRKSAP